MPTYEYECKTCGSVFDVFQSITAKPLRRAECEKCGETRPVRRLIGTGGGLIFKGSGFYLTDYRSEGYKTAHKADAEAGTKKEPEAKSSTATSATDAPKAEAPKADTGKTDEKKKKTGEAASRSASKSRSKS